MVGSTMRVNSVEVIKPPITTMARGFCTSEPGPEAKNIGVRPRMETRAVIRTGLSLRSHPVAIASSTGPAQLLVLMWLVFGLKGWQLNAREQRN